VEASVGSEAALTPAPAATAAPTPATTAGAAVEVNVAAGRRDAFDRLESMLFECLRRKRLDGFLNSDFAKKWFSLTYIQAQPVSDHDFTQFRVLGRGGFGLVFGCMKDTTGQMYAMKTMNRKRVKMKKAEDLCWNERNILGKLSSPFVVCLKYAFFSRDDLFLIIDLMTGGDLNFWLSKKGKFSEEESRYHATRVLLGIQHMHDHNIVYRDLKPENILMDEAGKTRISDLGLACSITPNLKGACGTRGYMAPEMLTRDASGHGRVYDHMVDWFSFGCVVYQFLSGSSPFRSSQAKQWIETRDKTQSLTKKERIDVAVLEMDVVFPPNKFDDPVFEDLCRGLLRKTPSHRLGSGPTGAAGGRVIMTHPWFGASRVHEIEMEYTPPPFVPGKDINTNSQQSIGSFCDDTSKIVIDEDDDLALKPWNFTSKTAFNHEMIVYLKYESEQGGKVKVETAAQASCCTIS